MLPPRKVKFEAKKRERENLEFRTFLKCNADEKELDEQFAALHEGKDSEGNYQTKNSPCDFLQTDGSCKLGECKPENCKNYPYTNQPERLWSLYSVLDAVGVCPVAFEIYERLKQEYGFRK